MAIHIGDKVVRSLPEEVSDLRKRIDEMEEPKHLYLHCLILAIQSDYSEAASTFILSKRSQAYDLESLIEYLEANNFGDGEDYYPASGEYSGDIAQAIYSDNGDIKAVSFTSGTTSSLVEDMRDSVIRLF